MGREKEHEGFKYSLRVRRNAVVTLFTLKVCNKEGSQARRSHCGGQSRRQSNKTEGDADERTDW